MTTKKQEKIKFSSILGSEHRRVVRASRLLWRIYRYNPLS